MKRSFKIVITMMLAIIAMANIVFAADNFTKRIVSVVYDDSWSMADNKQDYAYANYALQNIVGFMNENDELHVVRMSNKTEYQTINLSSKEKKKENIAAIASWKDFANETPFEAIETAIDCLKERKSVYGTSDNIEYWLLVLTDGDFEGMPQDPQGYLEGVNDYMSDVKYESIYVFISDKARANLRTIANNIPNTTCIDSADKEGICKALFEAAEKIYGRISIKGNDIKTNGNDISFDFPFPISKLTIYEQDQDANLSRTETADGNIISTNNIFEAKKVNEPVLVSKIIEVKDNNKSITSGNVKMFFESEADSSENKFQIMVDSAVSFELTPVDEDGKKVENLNSYGSEDITEFIARPVNTYTGEIIDLGSFIDKSTVKGEYNRSPIQLIYDSSNKYYRFNSGLKIGSNIFSATLELPGYFKSKSNVVEIYVPSEALALMPSAEPGEIKVGTKLSKDYEKVGTVEYTLTNLRDKVNGTLNFSNIPKGIQIKVNGATVKKNKVSLTLNEKNSIDIYRNKDYKETASQNISVNVELNDNGIKVKNKGCSFVITPSNRKVVLNVEKLFDDPDKLTSANGYNKDLYKVTPMIDGENISKQELKESNITFDVGKETKLKYKIAEKDGKNVYYVSIKKPLKPIIGDKSVDTNMNFVTPFGEEATEKISFYIRGNILFDILRLLIPLLAIIWMVGIIKKPRFEKKNHKIIVIQNGKEIHNAPLTVYGGFSSLVPFTPQSGKAYDLNIKAANTKKAIIVCKNSLKEGMRYDNEELEGRRLKNDLKVYEDTPLDYRPDRNNNTRYIYTDVVTSQINNGISSSRRGRR